MIKFKSQEEALEALRKYDDSFELADMLETFAEGESGGANYFLKEAACHIRAMYDDFRSAIYTIPEEAKQKDPYARIKSLSFEDIGLSLRARNELIANKINTVEQLIDKTEVEALNIGRLGKRQLFEIKERLTEHGLHFNFWSDKKGTQS